MLKKKSSLIILIIILSFNIPLIYSATEEGYGEGNDNLGQFVDSFENDDNVSVAYQVINNLTLECMELNYTSMGIMSNDTFQFREHKYYAEYNPLFVSDIRFNDYYYVSSTVGSLGIGHTFICFNRSLFDGYWMRVNWMWNGSSNQYPVNFMVYDGSYNRGSNVDFPNGAYILIKGNGLLVNYREWGAKKTWFTRDIQLDMSSGSQDIATLFFRFLDGYDAQWFEMHINWIEINEGSGGSGNIWRIDFNEDESVVMEVTGTMEDYGYVNNSGLPIGEGKYETEGYFITEDYLNYTTGNSLTLLTNTSIPVGTSMTVQFSSDNVTWVDNEGNAGSTSIVDGFYAIDLRNLNYTDDYKMVNFTGTPTLTPRLYQLREITTNGTISDGVSAPSEDYAGLLIVGLILGLIIGIGVSRS